MCGWVGRCRVSVRVFFFLDHGSGVVSILESWMVCVMGAGVGTGRDGIMGS